MKKIILFMLALSVCGCAAIGTGNKKVIRNNVFYSSSYPKLKVEINDKFKYLGDKVDKKNYSSTNNDVTLKRYIFADYDENRKINSGVEILIKEVSPGYWLSDIFGRVDKEKILLNSIEYVNEKPYNMVLMLDNLGNVDFYTDKGFIAPSKGFARGLARNLGPESHYQFMIFYWEDFDGFNELIREQLGYTFSSMPSYKTLDTKEQKVLNDFIDRSNKAFRLRELTELDKAVFTASDTGATESANAGINITDKLTELKKLKDEGIITEADYEMKKQEILKSY